MKKAIYLLTGIVLLTLMGACKNDWTIKDMPPVPEKGEGAGYVTGFTDAGAAVIIPVEVSSAGSYQIVVKGRATQDGTPGTGSVKCNGSTAAISFGQAYTWSECGVSLTLQAGTNNIEITGAGGNGLFEVDYIELR